MCTARFAARQKKVQKREALWLSNAAVNVVQTITAFPDMPLAPLAALISGMMDVLLEGKPSLHPPFIPSNPPAPLTQLEAGGTGVR